MNAIFLLGAGFNVDAMAESPPIYGHSIYIGEFQIKCLYPLLWDLPRICFEVDTLDQPVEELLAQAQSDGKWKPLERLARTIMHADYYLGQELTKDGAQNSYSKFFDHFPNAQFLTFNYDSLVERFLYCRRRWYPDDGYGLPVITNQARRTADHPASTSCVLHLHGTFCLYESDHQFIDRTSAGTAWYEEVDPPQYQFDPHSIAALFFPYRGIGPTFGYEPVERRVIAPLPNKSDGLRARFVRRMYQQAEALLEASGVAIAIGYAFGDADEASYVPLLRALEKSGEPRLLIVDPHAESIANRIANVANRLSIIPIPETFGDWARSRFAMGE